MTPDDPEIVPDAALTELVEFAMANLVPVESEPSPTPLAGESGEHWRERIARVRARHDAAAVHAALLYARKYGLPAPPAVAAVRDVDIPVGDTEISGRVYVPAEGGEDSPVIALVHGGAYWMGGGAAGLVLNDELCRHLCAGVGAAVVNVDHRLAPEHAYPTPMEDVYGALVWLADHAGTFGGDGGRLAVLGISSGGNLAAAACQLALDRGGPAIAAQVLQSPSLDLSPDSSRFDDPASEQGARKLIEMYRGGHDPSLAPLSPGRRDDLTGLPPALLLVSEFDPLGEDAVRYAARLRDAGVTADLKRYHMTHVAGTPDVHALRTADTCAWLASVL